MVSRPLQKKPFHMGSCFKTWGSTKNPPFFLLKNYGEKTAEAQRPEAHGPTSRDLMAYCDTCLVLRKVSRCLSRMREHISVKFEGGMRAIPGATILPKVSHRITYPCFDSFRLSKRSKQSKRSGSFGAVHTNWSENVLSQEAHHENLG